MKYKIFSYCVLIISVFLFLPENVIGQTQQKTISEELEELRARMNQERNGKENNIPEENKPIKKVEPEYIPQATWNDLNQSYKKKSYKKDKWALEDCIQYAIDNNIEIKQLKIQRESADIMQNTAKNSRLPDLNISMEQEWTFGRYSMDFQVLSDKVSKTMGMASSTIPIFTGFRIPNEIARTKLEFEAATQNLEKAKDNLSLHITSLFLQVLFSKELVKINEEQLTLSEALIARTEMLIKAGNVPQSNLYDIQAQVAKDRVSVVETKNNLDLSLLELSQVLELERNDNFDIVIPEFNESITPAFSGSLQPADLIYDNAVASKPVIKEQIYKVKSAEKALKVAQADYMPNLNLYLGIGSGYFYQYGDNIDPVTNQIFKNVSFSEQIKDRDRTVIGLNLAIPVFNRFQTRNKVRLARLDIQNQKLILENTKKILYKEIQTAYKNALASYEKYKASSDAIKSTSESFKHAGIRYEMAKLSPFEYNEAKTRFIQSQSELIQAKYDYILRTKILDFYNGIPIKL